MLQLTSLKAVQLQGAGVETVINNPDIPTSVPLLRIADPLMGQRMAMWVSYLVQSHFAHSSTDPDLVLQFAFSSMTLLPLSEVSTHNPFSRTDFQAILRLNGSESSRCCRLLFVHLRLKRTYSVSTFSFGTW